MAAILVSFSRDRIGFRGIGRLVFEGLDGCDPGQLFMGSDRFSKGWIGFRFSKLTGSSGNSVIEKGTINFYIYWYKLGIQR